MNIKTKKNGELEIRPSRGMTLIVETDLEKVKIKEVKEDGADNLK